MSYCRALVFAVIALMSGLTFAVDDVVLVTETADVTATVISIDQAKRQLVLRDDRAREFEMVAGPEVRNFNQIHKGDQIEVHYQRAAASRLEKIDEAKMDEEVTKVEHASAGAKPDVVAIRARAIAAKVIEIDTQHRLLTVQGPRGKVVTVRVPRGLFAFDTLEVGNSIAVGYTEAIAISVHAPGKKK